MQVLEQWVMLLDERGLRATGMELLIRVENGKAPPLGELCSSPEISLSEVERTISQDPSQCGEREVNTRTGMLPLHALLANQADWPDEILALLLKCNHRQARVADRHGNLPLHYLCKRFGLTERQLTMLIKCFGDAAKAPNRYGKLPLHFLARNPSLTRPMLALLVEAYPGATTARDQSGSLPLHYVAQNPSLSKETLQSFLAACGPEGSKEAAEAADKYGNVPLRHLVTSTAFTDQHLRVMLRANDRAVQVKDRYGNPPLEYLGFNREVSGFQQQVATEARRAIDRAELMVSDAEGAGRVVGDATALRLLMGVQKYALLFHDFSLAEVRSLVHGLKGQRMLVTRFAKGDVLVRRGEAATFFGLLLEGELGLRAAREAGGGGAGGGFPRRLHRGSLFGQSGLFDQTLTLTLTLTPNPNPNPNPHPNPNPNQAERPLRPGPAPLGRGRRERGPRGDAAVQRARAAGCLLPGRHAQAQPAAGQGGHRAAALREGHVARRPRRCGAAAAGARRSMRRSKPSTWSVGTVSGPWWRGCGGRPVGLPPGALIY